MRLSGAAALLGVGGLAALWACATSTPATTTADCAGFIAPKVLVAPAVNLPAPFAAVRLGAEMPGEVVVASDGALQEAQIADSQLALLLPFAEEALKHALFSPASIEGNPVAARVAVIVPVGSPIQGKAETLMSSLRAYVPGTESREARWQLRGSIERLTLVAHTRKGLTAATTIVAITPGGAEKTILTVPGSDNPREIRETVRTERAFAAAGTYRLELRSAGKRITACSLTVAEDYKQAIVNACEPLVLNRKTGPGN